MRIHELHGWDVEPREARELQEALAGKVVAKRDFNCIRTVAGADIAFAGDRVVAGVIVYRFSRPVRLPCAREMPYTTSEGPARTSLRAGSCSESPRRPHAVLGNFLRLGADGLHLIEVERRHAFVPLSFPYVPGLLSFREAPALIEAFRKVKERPDVILFDGQGIAHPRRLGLASHMGLVLNCPTIGCAKSRLVGKHDEPGPDVGDWAPLSAPAGEVVGAVLRTRKKVKPIYVSIGHRVDLASAIDVVLACLDKTRIPKPTREADRYVAELKP